jgi:gluconokinase
MLVEAGPREPVAECVRTHSRGEDAARMILILMGVTGSGKSTIGQVLSKQLGWEFRDADDFHSAANVEKMRAGIPLTDEDRWPWLESIRAYAEARLKAGQSSIVACPALKKVYRQVLLGGGPGVNFVHLKGDASLIGDRLAQRRGHFMNPKLLQSQFDTLEQPDNAFVADISGTPEEIARAIVAHFNLPAKTS